MGSDDKREGRRDSRDDSHRGDKRGGGGFKGGDGGGGPKKPRDMGKVERRDSNKASDSERRDRKAF